MIDFKKYEAASRIDWSKDKSSILVFGDDGLIDKIARKDLTLEIIEKLERLFMNKLMKSYGFCE